MLPVCLSISGRDPRDADAHTTSGNLSSELVLSYSSYFIGQSQSKRSPDLEKGKWILSSREIAPLGSGSKTTFQRLKLQGGQLSGFL
jgi:hypothetical protein